MLEIKKFTAYLGDFLDAYDKQSEKILGNSLAFGAWYEHLSRNLSDDELKPALQNALISFEFLPSPKQVVEAFKGSREVFALEEWKTCLEASKMGRIENVLLTPQGEKALASIGGFSRLASEDPNKLHSFVSKEFVLRWLMYERAINSGAIAPPPPKLPAAHPEKNPTEDHQPWSEEAKEKWRKMMEVLKKRQQDLQ